MQIEEQPDGTYATTPMYAGTFKDVKKADECDHAEWTDRGDPMPPPPEENAPFEMQMQTCNGCVATRMRFVGDSNEITRYLENNSR